MHSKTFETGYPLSESCISVESDSERRLRLAQPGSHAAFALSTSSSNPSTGPSHSSIWHSPIAESLMMQLADGDVTEDDLACKLGK